MWTNLLFTLLLFPTLIFAQEQDRYDISGYISTRARYQTNSDDVVTHNRIQGKVQLDGFISLTESGCIKARSQITTGKTFSNTWNETGIGDEEANLDINMRRLYLDMNCYLKNAYIQVGALPPQSQGNFGIKEDGWVDGVRAVVTINDNKKIRVALTAGEVDSFNMPNVFKRRHDGFNYYQVAIDGNISKRISFVADFSEHDTNDYMRAALKVAVNDLIHVLDSVAVENILTNVHQQGMMFSTDKQIGEWKAKVATTNINGNFLNPGTLSLPTEDFYGNGRNYQLFLDRPLSKKWILKTRLRNGEAGQRFEVRVDYKF